MAFESLSPDVFSSLSSVVKEQLSEKEFFRELHMYLFSYFMVRKWYFLTFLAEVTEQKSCI